MKKRIINLIITFIVGFIFYYITLPALNIHSVGFWFFLMLLFLVFGILSLGADAIDSIKEKHLKFKFNTIILIPIIILIIIIVNFISSPIFNARRYANRIAIDETGNFTSDVKEVDFTKTPLLDKSSSEKLGDRTMGAMSDLVSQYYVSDLYTQINYKEDIVRVTPLEYADLIKYFSNRKDGIKGYIMVNSVTGASKVVRLDKGMKYVPSAMFSKDMMRHLRFRYPTLIFGEYSFEIDDDGNPYFIVPIIKYSAFGLRTEITGVIVLDPITGDTKKYNVGEVPTWIDHVYNASLIIEQVDDWGTYRGGFWNSLFAEKNVVNTTDGYNYLAMDGDIYLYTGITSVSTDESNLGFILSNLRTKETVFYSLPGAEEYSAMASAEGQVQEMKYTSTFPLLINLNGRATYLVSLKDDAGLVKKYAFVDVEDYQKVSTSDAALGIETAKDAYLKKYKLEVDKNEYKESTITVSEITSTVIDGNTTYYIVDTDNNRYSVKINIKENVLPFTKIGDVLKIKYIESEINIIKSIG